MSSQIVSSWRLLELECRGSVEDGESKLDARGKKGLLIG